MGKLQEITRLNLALELVSECAGLVDADAVARVVGERLRWLFDSNACVLALRVGGAMRWLAMRSGDEALCASTKKHNDPVYALAEKAMASGSPTSWGQPMVVLAHPLGDPKQPLGALCIESTQGYSDRDLRFLHHVCSALGAALVRIEQADKLNAARALAAERDRAAHAEACAANDAKDTFLAILGHELRNPLAPILAAVELVRRDPLGPTLARVEIVGRQARHHDRLVGDLLDMSRVTTGKINLHRSRMDLREVMVKAAEMARPGIQARGQHLTMDLPAIPVVVDGDETRLAQVVSNLLNNASIYSGRDTDIRLMLDAKEDEVRLEIRDQGIGLAPDMLVKIFELFVQGGRSKDVAPGGLGLGLGVARTLVELHGGRILASSAGEGLGSTFQVILPLLRPEILKHAPFTFNVEGPAQRTVPRNSRKILLVDDNADAAESMGDLLRSSGHEVLVVYGPAEALASAISFAPDVALLDIGLLAMDGYELAQALRLHLGSDAPAMIALTGYGQESDRKRSTDCGFSAHLVKPAGLEELLAKVEIAHPMRVPILVQ